MSSQPGPSTHISSPPPHSPTPASLPEIPWAFIDCPTDTLIILISHMLNLLIQHNDQVVLTPDALTRFHSRAAPGISVIEYLRRIVKYTNMEKIPLLSLLAYIDITCQHLPSFTLSSLTVHRFLIAGVCAGSKAQCDVFCTNAHYAKVGGIKTQELNALEREFLKVTQWNLCCNADLLQRYYTSLIRSHGGYTQASPPTESPFRSFPRSTSKPPTSTDEVDETMPVEVDGIEEAEEDGIADEDNNREPDRSPELPGLDQRPSLDGGGMNIDQEERPDPQPSVAPFARGRGHGTGSRGSSHSRDRRGSHMDIDGHDDTLDTPYSGATSTSSVPSSSRSSLRSSSIRHPGRGRALSLSTHSDPKLASPKLDKTPASGTGVSWTTSSAQRNIGDKPPDNNTSNGGAEGGAGHLVDGHAGGGHGEHHGHHLLKSLGGIFHRRKSQHTERPPKPEPFVNGSGSSHAPAKFSQPPPDLSHPIAAKPNTMTSPVISSHNSQHHAHSPRSHKSPGLAKPVTPRIRTREDMSEEVEERIVGSVTTGPEDGKRRARVE